MPAIHHLIMKPSAPAPDILQTKTHFDILDGLRGIAAFAVVIFHFMEFVVPDYRNNFIAHGYLAVDFFFCLSGFVIAYAYDGRLEKIGMARFFVLRLIRLQPLVIIGSVIGLFAFLFDPLHNLYAGLGAVKTGVMFVASCLMIPYPVVPERYNNLFHLNPPTWSLFWEYIANIFYALVIFKLRNKVLWLLTFIAAGALCYTAYSYDNLSAGWGADSYPGGAGRVFYSFLAGMLVYRSGWIIRSPLGFFSVGVLLAVVFFVPYVNGTNRITEPLIVLFYFPLLVALGAGARLTPLFQRICKFSGEISYPLYMIHYPFLWIFYSYVETKKPAMSQMVAIVPIASILLVVLAYLIMVYLDIPIRMYLKNRLKKNL